MGLPQLTSRQEDSCPTLEASIPPLTPEGRRRMVECVLDYGWTVEATAERFQVDAKTVRKWRDRYRAEGSSWPRGSLEPAASFTKPDAALGAAKGRAPASQGPLRR